MININMNNSLDRIRMTNQIDSRNSDIPTVSLGHYREDVNSRVFHIDSFFRFLETHDKMESFFHTSYSSKLVFTWFICINLISHTSHYPHISSNKKWRDLLFILVMVAMTVIALITIIIFLHILFFH